VITSRCGLSTSAPVENPHLSFDIDEAARAVAALRAQGRTVLLHCVDAKSRTPIVAARYSVLRYGADPAGALVEVVRALPETDINEELRVHYLRLGSNVA
jgi:ADP-ribosyl-[dinitrogen reductase] hydrolase